jgi:hypothetical protein
VAKNPSAAQIAAWSKAKQEAPGYGHIPPPCFYCRHLLEDGDPITLEGWRCRAFPDGILHVILSREADHSEPLPYDNGFRYTVDPVVDKETGKVYDVAWSGELIERVE